MSSGPFELQSCSQLVGNDNGWGKRERHLYKGKYAGGMASFSSLSAGANVGYYLLPQYLVTYSGLQ